MESNVSNIQIIKWVWHHMTRMPWLCAGTLLFSSLVMTCQIFTPFLIANFLETFEVDVFDPARSALAAAWVIVVAWLGYYVFQYVQYQVNGYYQTQAIANCLNQLYGKTQQGFIEWFGNQKTGALLVQITRAARGYEVFTDNVYLNTGLIPSVVGAMVVIFILALKFPMIALGLFVITVAALIYLLWNCIYKVRPAYSKAICEESIMSGQISDRLSNYAIVKSFAHEEAEAQTLGAQVDKWKVLERISWTSNHNAGLVYGFFLCFCLIWASYYCITDFMDGTMSVSDVAFVFLTILEVNSFTQGIGRILLLIQQSMSDMEEGVALYYGLDTERSGGKDKLNLQKELRIQKLQFCYDGTDHNVLDIPDFTLPAGQRLGIVGHSGAGKSTLVGLLMGFYEDYEGSVTCDGTKLHDTSLHALRSNIALIPQDTTLFHRSLMDNIRYGNPQASDEEVIEAAKRAHADEFIAQLPQGYETLVGERGIKLSGGQRQRIAIARAILKDAPILILDEATSALDSESEKLIQDSLKELMVGKTVIAIAHRLSTIAHLDRLIVMEDGKIVEDGTHDELRAQGGIYASLWDMQSGGFLGE